MTWINRTPRLTTSPVTAKFFAGDGSGVFNATRTQVPVFAQSFPQVNFNPVAGTVTGDTSGVTPLTRPFTSVVSNASAAYAGTIRAEGSDLQAGVASLYSFNVVLTGSLNVPAAGPQTLTFAVSDGFVLGVGNGASRVSGPQTGTPATTPFMTYPVMGGVNQKLTPGTQTITVNFPAAGVYPYEIDYAEDGDGAVTLSLLNGTAPVPAATLFTLTPNRVATARAGDSQTLTLRGTDADGGVLANVPVTIAVDGTNEQSWPFTTDGTGKVEFLYGSYPVAGFDQVQAWATIGGFTAVSNSTPVTWNTGTNTAPLVSAGQALTLTAGSKLQLSGVVEDDGLPSGALTIGWTKVSGPGTVTFDAPGQAVTPAAISTPGSYVLQLTASDGVLPTSSTVTVNVEATQDWSPGWLLSPVDGSTVTGSVPVTLTSGITLTSGTLRYYPSNVGPTGAVVLRTGVTGSGQIGTLDTTLIPNGEYYVELQGTNSSGVTQTNLALITVTGEYKPGRVQSTVTDLSVPAAGLAIKIERRYDSLDRGKVMDFGYGWSLQTRVDLQVGPTGDVTFTMGGRRKTFYFTPAANPLFTYWYSPAYTAEAGLYGKLETLGDNCVGVLVRVGRGYRCGVDNAGAAYTATAYVYTNPNGVRYQIQPSGDLTSIRDLNGNTLTITALGITSSAGGLTVPFVRDGLGRITKITDPLGKEYLYTYDAAGDLKTVKYPASTSPAAYEYDLTHLLTKETDARGGVSSATYYADGRVKTATDIDGTVQFSYDTALRTTTVTNPDGGVEVTETDARGNVVRKVDGENRTTRYTYDPNDNLLTETNALNQTVTYTYDARGFKTSVKNALGQIDSAVFNEAGGPTSVTNALGKTQSVTYDSSFNLKTITDALGQIAEFTYNAQGLPLTMRDARGNTSSYTYDSFGNRASYTDPENRVNRWTYDSMGRKLTETNGRNFTTVYTYDDMGRVKTMTDAENQVTTYEYDNNGNKTAEVDALLRRTTFEYDDKDRLKKTTYPDLSYTSATYDFRGKKLKEWDQLGRETRYVYDKAGQLKSTTYAFGTADAATVSFTYDDAGRKLTETDERNVVTSFTYDPAGRMLTTAKGGKTTTFTYDAAGQRKTMTDPNLHTTSYDYDDRGRQTKVTYPDSKFVTYGYDGLGLRTSMTDQENRTTTWGYDKASQLVSVTNALSQVTTYGYDPAGNNIRHTDANNHSTTYEFDKVNRRTKRILPMGQYEQLTYDAVGNRRTRRDFNGRTTNYEFDSRNRLTSRTSDGVTFTYTTTGKRETMTDPSGLTTWTYDARDRVKTKAAPQGTLTYTWHPNGLVASVMSSNANGVSISYGYDGLNRLQAVTDNRLGTATTYTYDDGSRLSTVAYANGVVHSYGYDVNDRTASLQVTKTPAVLASYGFTRDNPGRKLTDTESSRSVSYGYDFVYKLITEMIGAQSITYGHDAVGNRLTRTSSVPEIPNQSFTYDLNDRLTVDTWDANGNTLTSGGHTYGYDFEDRLTSFDGSGTTMVYDGDGNRVLRTADGVTTNFLIDDLTPMGYAQVAEELLNGAVVRRYTHGLQRVSQTVLGGGTSWYGYDDVAGSVRQLFDSSGAVTDTYTYDAFGNLLQSTGSTPNVYRYRGEQWDESLRMYFLRARWYVSRTGSFLTADPWEYPKPFGLMPCPTCNVSNRNEIGRFGQMSCALSADIYGSATSRLPRYFYGNADAVNWIDPSGHSGTLTMGRMLELTITAYVAMAMINWVAPRGIPSNLQRGVYPDDHCFTAYLSQVGDCTNEFMAEPTTFRAVIHAFCLSIAEINYRACRIVFSAPWN